MSASYIRDIRVRQITCAFVFILASKMPVPILGKYKNIFEFLMAENDPFIIHIQYYCCWRLGDVNSQFTRNIAVSAQVGLIRCSHIKYIIIFLAIWMWCHIPLSWVDNKYETVGR